MTLVTFANYKQVLYDGAIIIYGSYNGTVRVDPEWNGGFRCGGRSVPNLLEEFDNVMLVS